MKVKCNKCGFKATANNCIICPVCGSFCKPYKERKVVKEDIELIEQVELQKLED
jgi:peptide subunit release factor 1 (eRF1)